MTDRLELASELRGLLEEIVADPRSSIRLTPRRALREWFDGGEAIRARSAAHTSAERHLVEAHREALAATLLEAAKIAYWKAPVLSLRPLDAQGKPYDERAAEERWRPTASRRAQRGTYPAEGVTLLRACLGHIAPERGHELAQASLALVPSDAARFYVVRTLPWDRPRSAISLLRRLAESAEPGWRVEALSSLGARLCALDHFDEARGAYRRASLAGEHGGIDWIFVFNLSCMLGDERSMREAAQLLDRSIGPADPRLIAVAQGLLEWFRARPAPQRHLAASAVSRVRASLTGVVAPLSELYLQ